MTVYLRPYSIKREEKTQDTFSRNITSDQELRLVISQTEQEKESIWFVFSVSLGKDKPADECEFIGLSSSRTFRFSLVSKNKVTSEQQIIGRSDIEMKEWVPSFKSTKEKTINKTITFAEYMVIFECKYNRFKEISGISTIQQFSLEPAEEIQKKMKKLNNQSSSIVSATKSLPESDSYPKLLVLKKQLVSIIEPANTPDKPKIQFFQGQCKTKNLFSCMDPTALENESKWKIIEQTYTET